MKHISKLAWFAVLTTVSTMAVAQTPPPAPAPQEPGISRTQADVIISELRQIRELLEKGALTAAAKPAAAPAEEPVVHAKMKLEGGQWLGDAKAPVTLVEFADYQCPFCKMYHDATYDQIIKAYVDTGKVRYTTRDLPLDFHPYALGAAQAARCAGEQGQYWQLRQVMIAKSDKLLPKDLLGYAKTLKMDTAKFKTCLDSGKYKDAVQKEATEAGTIGISATPSFVIGASTADGVDGVVFVGANPFADFEAKFKEAVAAPAKP